MGDGSSAKRTETRGIAVAAVVGPDVVGCGVLDLPGLVGDRAFPPVVGGCEEVLVVALLLLVVDMLSSLDPAAAVSESLSSFLTSLPCL